MQPTQFGTCLCKAVELSGIFRIWYTRKVGLQKLPVFFPIRRTVQHGIDIIEQVDRGEFIRFSAFFRLELQSDAFGYFCNDLRVEVRGASGVQQVGLIGIGVERKGIAIIFYFYENSGDYIFCEEYVCPIFFFGLAACRQTKKENWTHIFLTKNIIPAIFVEVKDNCNTFPLYTYPDQTDLLNTGRTPNLDPKIVAKIAESIGLEFEPEKSGEPDKFAPIDLLDYIYAVLHCPAYREKYREFLKADFPRVPYPENTGQFHRLTQTGAELRRLHLMENSDCWELSVTYPECGTDEITEVRYENEKVFINDRQYFGNVSPVAWNLFIGGYQPARKWLKDRIGKKLTFSDIRHYQKIIFALCRTDALMRTELNIEKF